MKNKKIVIFIGCFILIWGLISFNFKKEEAFAVVAPKIVSVEKEASDSRGDLFLVHAEAGTYPIVKYLVGTDKSYSTFERSANDAYVSMINGVWNVYAVDSQGNKSQPFSYTVTTSCEGTTLIDATGDGVRYMCGTIDYLGNFRNVTQNVKVVSCADGYYEDTVRTGQVDSNCRVNPGEALFSKYYITQRFCKMTYEYSCVKKSDGGNSQINISSELASLSINTGSLSPSFASSTKTYATTVASNVATISINATLKDSNASFVNGYGPRTVSLAYGVNKIEIKVKGSNETTYTINVTRKKDTSNGNSLSTNNLLDSLSVSSGVLSPSFNANTNSYTVNVGNLGSVDIVATLKDSKASFVSGYEPRTVNLVYGDNKVSIKVKSQSGSVRVYTINIYREKPESEPTPIPIPENSSALLKSLTLDNGNIDFEPNIFDYNVTVNNDVNNVTATVEAENENDLVEITGGTDLVVGSNELTIKVSSEDQSVSNTYTLYIIRKEALEEVSTNSLLRDLQIEGHKIKFDAKNTQYNITLNKNESELNILAMVADEKSSISIEGNEKLTTGSEIKIRVTAESGDYTDYYIKITGYKKSSNIFLTVVVVLAIIAVLAYIVLRILGYKIYFNLGAIKDYISNLFKK